MTMTETIPNHELERQYTEGSLQEKPEIIEAEDDLVHPEFRLWLTIKTNVGLPLPAVLIQNGIKLACEAKENFRESVRTNFHVVSGSLNNSTPVWGTAAESSVFKVDKFFFSRSLSSSFSYPLPLLLFFLLLPCFLLFHLLLLPLLSSSYLSSSSLLFFMSLLLCHLFSHSASSPGSIRFPILPLSARFFLHSASFLIRFLIFIALQLIVEVFSSIKFLVLMSLCRAYVLFPSSKPVSDRVDCL